MCTKFGEGELIKQKIISNNTLKHCRQTSDKVTKTREYNIVNGFNTVRLIKKLGIIIVSYIHLS